MIARERDLKLTRSHGETTVDRLGVVAKRPPQLFYIAVDLRH
jgi:hypothetical protein